MRKLLRHWPLALALVLAVCCGVCVWRLWAVSNLLPSQQAAQRWKGDGLREFSQLSFFMPGDQKLTLDQTGTVILQKGDRLAHCLPGHVKADAKFLLRHQRLPVTENTLGNFSAKRFCHE